MVTSKITSTLKFPGTVIPSTFTYPVPLAPPEPADASVAPEGTTTTERPRT